MCKYKYNSDLAYATSALRTVTVKRGKRIYEGKRSQKTDVRCQKMGRRKRTCEDKRDNAKVTQKP